MDCVAQLPMWAQPVLSGTSFGAAQFTAASGSTIELTSRLPNIFGSDGDYIDFMFFQPSAAAWTVFGSTVSPDAIILNDNTITITDGATSDSITLLASLSTTEWNHIRLIRNGSTIECYVATGDDSLVLELQTLDVIPLDLDIIGKNQDALAYVYAAKLYGVDGDHFSLASPSTDIQGTESGFGSRILDFYLESAHDGCILDCMSGNDGWKLEVRNVYLSDCRLVFSVGNGTDTPTELESPIIKAGKRYCVEINLEDLQGAEPDAGDTTIEGFSPHASNFYAGSERATGKFFDGTLQSLVMLTDKITNDQWTWWTNGGAGRSVSEIGAATEIATGDCTNAWPLSEASGTRADIIGSEDFTEVPGSPYSPTRNNGGFESWSSSTDLDQFTETNDGTTTINQDSGVVNSGTYAARMDVDASNSTGRIRDTTFRFTEGRTYDFSIYAGVDSLTSAPTFRIYQGAAIKDFSFSDTVFSEYTHQFIAQTGAISIQIQSRNNCASKSLYFDDMTFQATSIGRELGLRSSYLNAAAFTGYLRDVKLNALAGYVELPLYTDADDIGGDSNHGTATNVTFVAVDPGA